MGERPEIKGRERYPALIEAMEIVTRSDVFHQFEASMDRNLSSWRYGNFCQTLKLLDFLSVHLHEDLSFIF